MRQLRVMVVTLQYRLYAPAVVSLAQAIVHAVEHNIRCDHVQLYGNPPLLTDGHDIVTHKYREARRIFLAGDWWAFISIEDDMVVPVDAITRLVRRLEEADIAYGLYVWRHGHPRWSAYIELGPQMGRSISHDEALAREQFGQVIDVQGVGMGCTAIRRPVLEDIDFMRRGPACNDWYLAIDARRHGYRQVADLGLVCGHITETPSPRVLYPDPSQPDLYRVEFR